MHKFSAALAALFRGGRWPGPATRGPCGACRAARKRIGRA
ncbi:MAG TPA: hypothetical protein DCW29_13235 [Janthinobacterium sp.]|nr:hypothetical protein [Janthinobacterium sp.]